MANPDEFINAVEDELRQDQLRSFWNKWQFAVYALIAAVVLGVGGREAWVWHTTSQSEKASQIYTDGLQALEKGDQASAQAKFDELIKSAPEGYKSAALQARAEISLRKGDQAGAQKLLEEAANAGPDKDMRSAAAIKAAYIAMEKEDSAKLTARLQPVIDRKGPFASMAQEIIAAKLMDEGKLKEAHDRYQSLLLALDAPEGVKQRAQVAMALLPPQETAGAAAATEAPKAGGKPADKGGS